MYMFMSVSDAKGVDILRVWHVMREIVASSVSAKGNYDGKFREKKTSQSLLNLQ